MPLSASDYVKIISEQERELVFDCLTEEEAWTLGTELRSLFLERTKSNVSGYEDRSIVISMALFNGHTLFQTAVGPGSGPDNWNWVAGKTAVVKRYNHSSYFVRQREFAKVFGASAFEKFLKLAPEPQYFAHGGGFPIFLKGAGSQAVGAIVVSGLPMEHDHQLVVDGIRKAFDKQGTSTVVQ